MSLPVEVIILIFSYLSPRQQFKLGTSFLFTQPQYASLPFIEELCVDNASNNNRIGLLDLWLKSGHTPIYTEKAVDFASATGHLNVLEWWKHSNLPLKYTKRAVELAATNSHFQILEWWRMSNLELKCTVDMFDRACEVCNVDIVLWWLKCKLPTDVLVNRPDMNLMDNASCRGFVELLDIFHWEGLDKHYSEDSIDQACMNGHINVLNWWWDHRSTLDLIWSEQALMEAVECGKVEVLNWWLEHKIEIKNPRKLIDFACDSGIAWFIDWWCKSGLGTHYITAGQRKFSRIDNASNAGFVELLEVFKSKSDVLGLEYSAKAMDFASQCTKAIEVLNWWRNSGFRLKHTYRAIDEASRRGRVDVLDWWNNSGFHDLAWSAESVDGASAHGHVNVLDWWKESGKHLIYTDSAIDDASLGNHTNVLDWWRRSDLKLKYTKRSLAFHSVRCLLTLQERLNVLEWWGSSGLSMLYDPDVMDFYSRVDALEILQWWERSNLPVTFTYQAMDGATEKGYIRILEFWRTSRFRPLQWSADVEQLTRARNRNEVIQWWDKWKITML
ncbi:hypothetical protein HK098_000664 [Nowakowskiella sp. JEL0407]|nr:hypothetical protein HK098_000664 [Nowakowskiella sp. JEL0407]